MALSFGLGRPCRAVYLSDLHYAPWCTPLLAQLGDVLQSLAPDLVLLGGDLLDLPWNAEPLYRWLRELQQWRPVYAVPGNHDRWVGLARLKRNLSFLHWLDEEPACHSGVRLCGRSAQGADERSVLVAHEPTHVRSAARHRFPVVLAGHLHGCQWIAFQRRGYDYPGAWFFAYHGPYFEVDRTRMWVSRGVNDQFPLRIGCPRDLLLLEID